MDVNGIRRGRHALNARPLFASVTLLFGFPAFLFHPG